VSNGTKGIEKIWLLESPASRIASLAMVPLSWLYAAGWKLYLGVYRAGIKRRKRFDGLKVVGVGNLQVGGTGKTPIVIALASLLKSRGVDAAISVSAYGSPASKSAAVAPEVELDPDLHGDEACLIRENLPNALIVLGRDRVRAAQLAVQRGAKVLILDDGFQHLPLFRDVDIVVWSGPGGNMRCLPAGPLREPLSGLDRSDAVFVSQPESGLPDVPAEKYGFKRISHQIVSLDLDPVSTDWLAGRRVDILCAIARPDRFEQSVRALGAIVKNRYYLRDHDSMHNLPAALVQDAETPCIVTEKDAVKLRRRGLCRQKFFVLKSTVEFDDPEAVYSWLIERVR
jgi:tetraacyldisaccharide 4'-kinase